MKFLDIIRDVKNRHPEFPLAAYQVSGEYAMLMKSADAGIIDLKRGVFEAVNAIRRAGCDIVISYFTPKQLNEDDAKIQSGFFSGKFLGSLSHKIYQ